MRLCVDTFSDLHCDRRRHYAASFATDATIVPLLEQETTDESKSPSQCRPRRVEIA